MGNNKIIFRADGNSEIGLGHITRSLALAEMLRNDFCCVFATRFLTEYIEKEIKNVCTNIIRLPHGEDHFNAFLNLLGGDEIVVLDNYFYETGYQKAIKDKGCKLVCIDDLHDKHFVADAVINHAGGVDKSVYSAESYTQFCLGTSYALLREIFLRRVETITTLPSVFICMGGTDKNNDTTKILSVLENRKCMYTCDVVIGDAFLHEEELFDYKNSSLLRINIYKKLFASEIADVMSKCFSAICPPSTVSYEYLSRRGGELYLKQTADNQKDIYNFYLNNKIAFDITELFIENKYSIEQSLTLQEKNFDRKSKERFLIFFKMLSNENSDIM